jgi:hypothetical protein
MLKGYKYFETGREGGVLSANKHALISPPRRN